MGEITRQRGSPRGFVIPVFAASLLLIVCCVGKDWVVTKSTDVFIGSLAEESRMLTLHRPTASRPRARHSCPTKIPSRRQWMGFDSYVVVVEWQVYLYSGSFGLILRGLFLFWFCRTVSTWNPWIYWTPVVVPIAVFDLLLISSTTPHQTWDI